MKKMQDLSQAKEKVLVVAIEYKPTDGWTIQDVCDEMKELVQTSGGEVIETIQCRLDEPTARTLIGKGKVEEIAAICKSGDIDLVIFSFDLKGSQQRNLEEEFGVRTIDRTQLILDIFARHATSNEGKMQVELAQMEYMLPRLVGKGIEMSRLGGGIGTMGPGETKLEVDRRRITDRVDKLKKDLKEVTLSRQVKRKKRQDQNIPTISLVGYTNAGKSTLLNTLTDAGQVTHNGLFTTLDSLSRQMSLPNHRKVVFSDTVGFIHDLPHRLIEAFKATLEEVQQADLLLHVVDASSPNFEKYFRSVEKVLGELEVLDKPTIIVLNKIDKMEDPGWLDGFCRRFPNAVAVSALNKTNIDALTDKIMSTLSADFEEVQIDIPIGRMDLVNLAHKEGKVHSIKYLSTKIHLKALLPKKILNKFVK